MKKSNFIYTFTSLMFLLIFFYSCKKDDPQSTPTLQTPELTTSAISNLTSTSATCGGNITSDGNSAITSRGVCWSTSPTPTISNNKTTDGTGVGSFSSSITGLTLNTTYYVRAYATNSEGTSYGNEIIFKTYTGTVSDIDGNIYNTITIGTQVWMVENLKTSKYRNGNSIPNVTDSTQWRFLSTGAYCDYENNPSNSTIYGKLYNWYAVTDVQNIAPTGWHVPTDIEMATLKNYLGGDTASGGKLKEAGISHWLTPNTGATNESGFSGLPGGERDDNGMTYNGGFQKIGTEGTWWSSTEFGVNSNIAIGLNLRYNKTIGYTQASSKKDGYSVRCLKD